MKCNQLLLEINIDGASRGNPGLSAIGITIKNNGQTIIKHGEFIGTRTNNQAEYEALKKALELCKGMDNELIVLSDSELLINQRNLKYKIRNQQLKEISREISQLEKNYMKITYRRIPRGKNTEADKMANKALDEHLRNNILKGMN